MSCYEWQRGNIILPTAEVGKFKKAFREVFNGEVEKLFITANQIYMSVITEGKGKRKFDYQDRVVSLASKNNTWEDALLIEQSMYPGTKKDWMKPFKPQKKAFPVARNNTQFYNEGGLEVGFNGREISYSIEENNHSVDHAGNTRLSKAFWRAMNGVLWTRGTGGKIVGNDEYNREGDEEGGGANYVCHRLGPRGGTQY